ncbi:acetyl-CoA synthetase [Limimonas halophila]|uniref:Acetyl-CoA synthetase n=1 Tax=Limimonas halophila TaxID=1082479 RepID=A0A1G7Q6A5_9PROT|nr:acetate--CoA ligase family protein [Limimonas halophila]SDF93120.1 acetyl-CoA synthetase [Limimonas halophila]
MSDSSLTAARRRNLQRVLTPRHVAVIGGGAAAEAARQLDALGFQGQVWPVNPRRTEIAGRACHGSVAELPEAPDAAVVAAPAAQCPCIFAELNRIGAGGGVCFAAHFREDGAADLEAELVEAAGDCVLVGPNSHGILNLLDRVALWPDDHCAEPVEAGAALISQSGNVALNSTFHRRSVPLSHVVSAGNQAQLDIGDFMDALLDDARVHAIGLFIEGLRDVRGFARAARRALERDVPVVALKVGASDHGARATLGHTGSLSGADAAYDALFDRLGVMRVRTPEALLETLKLFTTAERPAGRRLVSLSCSGGEAALAGDLMSGAGLVLPAPSEAAAGELAKTFRIPRGSVGNPLDYNTAIWGDADACADGFAAAMGEGTDIGVHFLDFPRDEACDAANWRAARDGFLRAHRRVGGTAAMIATYAECFPEADRRACVAAGVAPLQGLQPAVTALGHAAAHAEWRRRLLDEAAWTGPLAGAGPRTPPRLVDEGESKRRLAAHGLSVPDGRCVGLGDVGQAAEAVGFPVVLKAVGLAHKTDAGAVALNLQSAEAVRAAADAIADRLAAGDAAPDRWLVETMVPDAVAELIVGVTRDDTVGPVLVVGDGGVFAELIGRTRTLLLPTTEARVREAITGLTTGRRLLGQRGDAGGDLDAAVAACMAVARYVEANADSLAEIDVNPLLVRPPGRGAVAADALIAEAVHA